jgi:hypothetical protein
MQWLLLPLPLLARSLIWHARVCDATSDAAVTLSSYLTKEALKNDLVSKCPIKIDIGAVYNAPPNMHQSVQNFMPLHKELVFDIDMTVSPDSERERAAADRRLTGGDLLCLLRCCSLSRSAGLR